MSGAGAPIRWPVRAWLAVEVCFGVAAVLAIGIAPQDSAKNFAWPIRPIVMASVLGAFYFTSAPLFVLPLFARRWESIRVMILPAALFCALQLLATILHWEKFTTDGRPFAVWLASYVLPPPILVAAYLWQQRGLAPQVPDPTQAFAPILRAAAIGCGAAFSVIGTLSFVFPAWLVPRFAWTLTPLTTRSMSSWLVLFGVLLLAMAREDDRTRCRLASLMLLFALPALVVQILRFRGDVDAAHPSLWIGLTLFAVAWLVGLALARGSWRAALH